MSCRWGLNPPFDDHCFNLVHHMVPPWMWTKSRNYHHTTKFIKSLCYIVITGSCYCCYAPVTPLALCCDWFDCGSRQAKCDQVDLVTVDYDITICWQKDILGKINSLHMTGYAHHKVTFIETSYPESQHYCHSIGTKHEHMCKPQ